MPGCSHSGFTYGDLEGVLVTTTWLFSTTCCGPLAAADLDAQHRGHFMNISFETVFIKIKSNQTLIVPDLFQCLHLVSSLSTGADYAGRVDNGRGKMFSGHGACRSGAHIGK